MFKSYFSLFSLFLITSVMLSGCASKAKLSPNDKLPTLTPEQRTAQLLKNTKWQLQGKIAFIKKTNHKNDKRESASIYWQVDEENQTQTLNLTSFLGLNVLHLESNKNQHIINVDGNEYRSTNLAQLIYSLTDLTLPTNAMTYWLKGLPYNEPYNEYYNTRDKLEINPNTLLPTSISSYYHNALWQINYSNYQVFEGLEMATQFTIKKKGLVIKIAVKKWSFDE